MLHDHVQKIKFLTPPQGPRGWGPKKCAGACANHVINSNTKSGWILKKKLKAQLPTVSQSPTSGHDPGG